MSSIGLALRGEFKFDLYDTGRNLLQSSNFTDNFITNSGVMYPCYFAFADCFRYVSIGTGTGVNSIVKNNMSYPETTGLQFPLTGYEYVGGRQNINGDITTTNYAPVGCGFTETASGINLFREWMFPDNTGGYFTGYQTFNEFMVTPGKPYVTGLSGVSLCTCDETDGIGTFGNDNTTAAQYYTWLKAVYMAQEFRLKMCDATKAFARVVYPINIIPYTTLNITYRLTVTPNTGISMVGMNNSSAGGPYPNNWSGLLNTITRITQPGIKLINDGTIINPPSAPNDQDRLQHFNYSGNINGQQYVSTYHFNNEYGESFIPSMGIPLEPSNVSVGSTYQNIAVYLSSDNIEFLVGPSGYVINTGNFSPWNSGSGVIMACDSGLAPFLNNNSVILNEGGSYWTNNPNTFNIRTSSGDYPNTGDITLYTSPGIASYYLSPARFNPIVSWLNIGGNVNSGIRTGQVSYVFSFQVYGQSYYLFAKSLVAGYKDLNFSSYYECDPTNMVPFFDSIFSGTGIGSIFLPSIITGNSIYTNGNNTGAHISGSNNNNYFYLANVTASAYPIFNTMLSWSAPCPSGVTGC